jgi:hypothetical protein
LDHRQPTALEGSIGGGPEVLYMGSLRQKLKLEELGTRATSSKNAMATDHSRRCQNLSEAAFSPSSCSTLREAEKGAPYESGSPGWGLVRHAHRSTMSETLLDRWERAFRAAAVKDDCANFRGHLQRLALPNKPELVLEGTVSAVRMASAYLSMDGRDKAVGQLLRMQTYDPAEATDARYVLTFDIFRKAFARILVDATLQPLDLADMYGSMWDDYKMVGFDSFWISHPDWAYLTKREAKKLEKQVTYDLRFDYTDDELEFWFDDSRDKSYLVVTLLPLS